MCTTWNHVRWARKRNVVKTFLKLRGRNSMDGLRLRAYLGNRRAAWPGPPTAGTSWPNASARASKISSSSSTIAAITRAKGNHIDAGTLSHTGGQSVSSLSDVCTSESTLSAADATLTSSQGMITSCDGQFRVNARKDAVLNWT